MMKPRGTAILPCLLAMLNAALVGIAAAQPVTPVLEFPQAGLDDTSTYRGYLTRFYREAAGNAVQVAINHHTGRVVNLWADASNESISFTARDSAGQPARLWWGSDSAIVMTEGKRRFLQYDLVTESSALELGHFVLASMRKERDFQYSNRHLLSFNADPYVENEYPELLALLARLPREEQSRHLAALRARTVAELRPRLQPVVDIANEESRWTVSVTQPTFDGRNLLSLEISAEATQTLVVPSAQQASIRSIRNQPLRLTIRIGTDSPALTPLAREHIFNQDFMRFYAARQAEADGARSPAAPSRLQRLERQVRSVELLSYHEKLMAGLPNFATYFGRDMMMSALMLEPIWSPAMLEHVIASVLRKLDPAGEVSHEEALGGQAIRENAAEYNRLIKAYFAADSITDRARADSLLRRGRERLSDLQAVHENYMMVDDDFQLPVLAARYLARRDVSAASKRNFLLAPAVPGKDETRLALLLRNLDYVVRTAAPYAASPTAINLVSFRKRDEQHWHSGSWRDSNAGYAGGRFAMDINAVWVPNALQAVQTIATRLRELGFTPEELQRHAAENHAAPLAEYLRTPATLATAVQIWRGAGKHFWVSLNAQQVQQQVQAKLAWLPPAEKAYWDKALAQNAAANKGIEFLALALDSQGRPLPVANTDPATLLFLENFTEKILNRAATPAEVLKLVEVFVRPYPVGLFVAGVGPLVANDVYAPLEIWETFKRDPYHSPTVVWGREVNLLMLGLSKQILAAYDEQGRLKNASLANYVGELRRALDTITAAVEASGLKHNELWSYKIEHGNLVPSRYPASCDIQLWNLTDLAVQYSLALIARLPTR